MESDYELIEVNDYCENPKIQLNIKNDHLFLDNINNNNEQKNIINIDNKYIDNNKEKFSNKNQFTTWDRPRFLSEENCKHPSFQVFNFKKNVIVNQDYFSSDYTTKDQSKECKEDKSVYTICNENTEQSKENHDSNNKFKSNNNCNVKNNKSKEGIFKSIISLSKVYNKLNTNDTFKNNSNIKNININEISNINADSHNNCTIDKYDKKCILNNINNNNNIIKNYNTETAFTNKNDFNKFKSFDERNEKNNTTSRKSTDIKTKFKERNNLDLIDDINLDDIDDNLNFLPEEDISNVSFELNFDCGSDLEEDEYKNCKITRKNDSTYNKLINERNNNNYNEFDLNDILDKSQNLKRILSIRHNLNQTGGNIDG